MRALLLDAARAEFERAGYAGATTAAIAARAETTEAQLFRCFRSKAGLFRAAVLDPLDRAFEAFNAARLEALPPEAASPGAARRYIADLAAFVRAHEHLLMSLIVAQAYGGGDVEGVAQVGGLGAYFEIGARTMRAQPGRDPGADPALLVRVSFGAVLAATLFRDWMFGGVPADDRRVAEALAAFVSAGIGIGGDAMDAPRDRG